ncbi:MAG: ATP-dependent RNA helicase HrpA [Gammaproteobacteria bacterium]|nr:ATP-dependent RNA helicase HrpA [Gammaproteobacteria bacterium]
MTRRRRAAGAPGPTAVAGVPRDPGADTAAGARLAALEPLLDDTLFADRERFRKRARALLQRLERAGAGALAAALGHLEREVRESAAAVASRAALRPVISYPPSLPISAALPDIAASLAAHQVTIVCGATGSGKSTQLPKLCLELGRGIAGRIGHTQPRRIAARTIAGRVATELGTEPGEVVGYQVRFEERLAASTRLKIMTDGILLQEIHHDRLLLAYDTLIIDEVHERSLNVDFLLGYLKRVLPRRPELRLILTSATIAAERFSAFFDDARVFDVPGTTHPVELRYRAPEDADADLNEAIVAAIEELDAARRGDVLVFLPGEREINEAREALARRRFANTEVLPLYARLSARDQQRVFAPHAARHVVLATNVAETSLTVPGVTHVVDSGLARIGSYSPRTKLQRLPVTPISKASAAQRAGRCGRERPGICIRLYGETDFEKRPAYTAPEIKRSNLAGVILRLAAQDLGAVEDFPFLDSPEPRAINDGYTLLRELGALDAERRVLPIGRQMARLPLDPRLARMVIAAGTLGCLREMLVIAAAMSVGDPRETPPDAREAAAAAHAVFADQRSDFLWYVNAWRWIESDWREASRRRQSALCRERFLAPRRVRDWVDTHAQLASTAQDLGLHRHDAPADYGVLHRALLTGLPTQVGKRDEKGDYLGCRSLRFRLHPTSALRGKAPPWIVAGEIVETTANYARLAARIDAAWIGAIAPQLVKRRHDEPAWDVDPGRVTCREEQSLLGLVLTHDRRVFVDEIEPATARRIFIERALVAGELGAMPEFLAHNLATVAAIAAAEERARRRDIALDPAAIAALYAARLPPDIASRKALLNWLRHHPARGDTLRFTTAELTRPGAATLEHFLYPDRLRTRDGLELALEYRFDPGGDADGVTVEVPLAVLGRLDGVDGERLVPGLLGEKIAALLKRLPKTWRRYVSPLNEFAQACTAALEETPGPLPAALSAIVRRLSGVAIPLDCWNTDEVPGHLRMRYRIVDAGGRELAAGRDLAALRARCAEAAGAAFAATPWGLEARSRGGWTFGPLPERVSVRRDGLEVTGHPALVPAGEEVTVDVLADPAAATAAHRRGVAHLVVLSASAEMKYLRKLVAGKPRLGLHAVALGMPAEFTASLVPAAVLRCLPEALPRDEAAFERVLADVRRAVTGRLQELLDRLGAELATAAEIRTRLDREVQPRSATAAADMKAQLAHLYAPDFLHTHAAWLTHYPRYLRGMVRRIERLLTDPPKDERKAAAFLPLRDRHAAAGAGAPPEAGFLLEELRISVFAPELKTAVPVSAARLEQLLAAGVVK